LVEVVVVRSGGLVGWWFAGLPALTWLVQAHWCFTDDMARAHWEVSILGSGSSAVWGPNPGCNTGSAAAGI